MIPCERAGMCVSNYVLFGFSHNVLEVLRQIVNDSKLFVFYAVCRPRVTSVSMILSIGIIRIIGLLLIGIIRIIGLLLIELLSLTVFPS